MMPAASNASDELAKRRYRASVTIDYHMASGMVPNLSGCTLRSARWTNLALIGIAARQDHGANQRPSAA
jgi:hypothetical protein